MTFIRPAVAEGHPPLQKRSPVVRVLQKAQRLPKYGLRVRPHEDPRPRGDGLGTLREVPKDQHGLPERGGLLLDPPAVAHDEEAPVHDRDEVGIRQGLREDHPGEAPKLPADDLADGRVLVEGRQHPHLGMRLDEGGHSPAYTGQGLPPRFPSMRRHQYEGAVLGDPVQDLRPAEVSERPKERIDDGIARHEDSFLGHPLAPQVLRIPRGRSEEKGGQPVGEHPIGLLREGKGHVVAAQPRLDMPDRDAAVEARQGGPERRRRVPVHQQHVLRAPVQEGADPQQNGRGHVIEGLAFPHDVQVDVRRDSEMGQSLLQHVGVLPAGQDRHDKAPILLQQPHERRHLDGLRPGPDDTGYPMHKAPPPPSFAVVHVLQFISSNPCPPRKVVRRGARRP